MKVIQSHKIVYFDVDETLIIFRVPRNTPGLIPIKNPRNGVVAYGLPHERHIELLKEFAARGHTVVVWSQGGWAWAEQAVKVLGLEDAVDFVMSKPDWYVDDKKASSFLPNPIYLDPSDANKDHCGWGDEEEPQRSGAV